MVKTIFFENLFNNMRHPTSLIVSQIPLANFNIIASGTAIFLPRPDAKALGDGVQPRLACILLNFSSFRGK
jgi:hypothetical protein